MFVCFVYVVVVWLFFYRDREGKRERSRGDEREKQGENWKEKEGKEIET